MNSGQTKFDKKKLGQKPLVDLDYNHPENNTIKKYIVDFNKISSRANHHNAIIDKSFLINISPTKNAQNEKNMIKTEKKIEKRDFLENNESKVYVNEIVKYYRKKKKNELKTLRKKMIFFNELSEINLKSPEFIITHLDTSSPIKVPLREKEILSIRAKTLKKYTSHQK